MVVVRRVILLAGESLSGTAEVVFELAQAVVGNLTLEIALLLAGLAASLRLRFNAGPSILLRMVETDDLSKATVTHSQDGTLSFALGKNQVEYFHSILLRAYRDGMAEVNHVHLEGEYNGTSFDLTIIFDVSNTPFSAEEAERLLAD